MAEDLNAMRTLALLYETRSVTAAADRLHVSQPTVSYTLGRLRRRFSDDLFRRQGNALVPTALADRLYEAVGAAVAQIDRAVASSTEFNPSTFRGEVVLALSSLGEISFLPAVLAAFTVAAPQARLRITPLLVDSVEEQLLRGEVDLAVTMTVLRSERIARETFFDVEYVAVTSAGHPLPPGESALRERRFVEVTGRAGHVFLRDALHQHGLAERVFLVVEGHASLPHLLAAGDLVALLPRHYAEIFRHQFGLSIQALPWSVPSPPVALYSRRPSGLSAAQSWARTLTLEALRDSLPAYSAVS